MRAPTLSTARRDVYLKIESELPTGSFKVRGAVYALSTRVARGPVAEVVAASTGNHGAAVAYAARLLGVPATIFLPRRANPVKSARIRELGARLVEHGDLLIDAIDAADEHCRRTGAYFLDDSRDPDVPVGASTIGAEIVSQLPGVHAIYVPMGDTALIRAVASAAKELSPSIRITGVVAERAPAYYLSWQQRAPVPTETADTIADGLAVTRPLADNVAAICAMVDRVVTVGEDEMRSAIEHLMKHENLVAEPAGAAATAALIRENPADGRIVLLVTGGNLAPGVLR